VGPLRDIGAIAGLGAFLGVAVLALLYFSQARDVRRLRDWAGRAPERDAEDVEATSGLAAERAEEIRTMEEERRRREEAVEAERKVTADRDARRKRRAAGLPEQTRLERLRSWISGGIGGRASQGRYVALAAAGVVVVGVAAALVATQLVGKGGSGSGSKQGVLKPSQVQVDVLNGTNPPVNGLAGLISDRLESEGYHTGHVGNSSNAFSESVVMFKRGYRPEAKMAASKLRIARVRLLSAAIRNDTRTGDPVVVIVGQDKSHFTG